MRAAASASTHPPRTKCVLAESHIRSWPITSFVPFAYGGFWSNQAKDI